MDRRAFRDLPDGSVWESGDEELCRACPVGGEEKFFVSRQKRTLQKITWVVD